MYYQSALLQRKRFKFKFSKLYVNNENTLVFLPFFLIYSQCLRGTHRPKATNCHVKLKIITRLKGLCCCSHLWLHHPMKTSKNYTIIWFKAKEKDFGLWCLVQTAYRSKPMQPELKGLYSLLLRNNLFVKLAFSHGAFKNGANGILLGGFECGFYWEGIWILCYWRIGWCRWGIKVQKRSKKAFQVHEQDQPIVNSWVRTGLIAIRPIGRTAYNDSLL